MFRYAGAAVLGIALGLANAFSYVFDYQPVNYAESIIIGVIDLGAGALVDLIVKL